MATRAQARRGLAIYFAVLIPVSAFFEAWVITHGGLVGPFGWLVLPLMYTPAISSIVARTAGREGFSDVSFRWGGRAGTRAVITGWLFPVFVGFVAYGAAWSTGLVGFSAPAGGHFVEINEPALRFAAMLGRALTIGTLMSMVSAFGEELGWRGFMVPRLVEAQLPAPLLISGLIWWGWHIPLILWGGYAVGPHRFASVLLFGAMVVPTGILYGKWRMASGSIWPSVVAHGAWNVLIQSVFDRFSSGAGATVWVGESGILTVIAVGLLFLLIHRAPWAGTGRQAPSS